jgi:hypothetical protein
LNSLGRRDSATPPAVSDSGWDARFARLGLDVGVRFARLQVEIAKMRPRESGK